MRSPRSSGFLFALCVLGTIITVQSHHGCPFHHPRQHFGRPQRIHQYYLTPIRQFGPQNPGSACISQQPRCTSNTKYYSFDGSCNNLQNPSWGQSGTPYNRLMPAHYADAKCALRRASNGLDLPVARNIRTTIIEDYEVPSRKFNIFYYAFGQWIDHDVTGFAPMNTQTDCCRSNDRRSCLPLVIPERDRFYSQFGVTCIDLKRANNTYALNCELDKPCVPINFQTSWLDLSILYGPNKQVADDLRLFRKGLLKFQNDSMTQYQLFPPITSGATNCPRGGIDNRQGGYCIKAGDVRVNQNPELTILELVFYKFHQLSAVAFSALGFSDEEAFQKSRRLLIAMYQHIIFSEYVVLTIGRTATMKYNLKPREQGYGGPYNSQVNGQTNTEYSFAVGRAPHSQIKGIVTYWDKGQPKSYQLRNKYFNQRFILEKNVFESLMLSYTHTDDNAQDEFGSEEISNYLLRNATTNFGSDLQAIDIMRGLDAGLQTYNNVRAKVGLPRLIRFEDLMPEVTHGPVIDKLKSVYPSVEDIDLYVGGMIERPVEDSSVGPTFTHIFAETFSRWKFGDRLFYEFPESEFALDELNEIREKVTFAYLLCHANPAQQVPKNAFLIPSPSNPLVDCHTILQNGPQSKIFKTIRSTKYAL